MPSAEEILTGLAATARSWQALALLWHAYFAAFGIAILLGWRPTHRLAGLALMPPLASVSILAWLQGNPFNGIVFAVLALAFAGLLRILGPAPVRLATSPWLLAGSLLAAFGWVYPHFLESEPAWAYLYAAPLGLVPCPTLAMAAGFLIILRGLGSRACTLVLFAAALFYGIFGSLYLGVGIDWVLTAGAVILLVLSGTLRVGARPALPVTGHIEKQGERQDG